MWFARSGRWGGVFSLAVSSPLTSSHSVPSARPLAGAGARRGLDVDRSLTLLSCPGPIERCGAVQALLRPAAGALHTCGLGVRRHPRAPQFPDGRARRAPQRAIRADSREAPGAASTRRRAGIRRVGDRDRVAKRTWESNHSPWKRRHRGSSCEPDRPIFAVPRGSVGGVFILARFAFPPGRAPRPAVSWLGTSGALATSDDRCRRRVFPADCSRPRGRRVGYDECGGDAVASCSALSSLAIWSRVIASARDGRPRGSPPRAVAGGTTSNRARQPTTVN